jgi:glycosyltransferase involved in cell wall biosynthesis
VVIVQSLQYFDFPQIYSWPQLVYLRSLVPHTLRKATRVIALSQTSKQTILEKVHIPPNRIHVVYHGLSSDIERNREGEKYKTGCRLVQSLSDGKPYILSVSSFYWQKNLLRLIKAFSLLKRCYSIPHQLLLVGGNSVKITQRDLLFLASRMGVGSSVICPGVIPHELVPAFYMHASVSAMPSLYETFGHPILEAMSCGCPVVTSNTGTMAELAQECAALVDPYNVESIAEGIARVLGDTGLRDMMVARGRVRAQAFTLEAQVRGYVKVLEEAACV